MSEPIRYGIPRTLAAMPRDAHHVVEASAGTGKTYLIEHRVVDLILHTSATIDQLLVVTFTEKATAELRLRIRKLLDKVLRASEHSASEAEPHWLIDGAARQRLAAALFGFDAAPIHTIHAFCQRVLVDNAFDNRRLFEQSQVATQTAFATAFRAALRERFAVTRPERDYLAAWLRKGKTVADLERLLLSCSTQPGQLVPVFDPGALEQLLARGVNVLWPSSSESPTPSEPPDAYDDFGQALHDAGLSPATVRTLLRRADLVRELVGDYAKHGDLARFVVDTELMDKAERGALSYLVDKLGGVTLSAPGHAAAVELLCELARGLVPFEAAIAQLMLPEVSGRMIQSKAERGLFDFGDMLRLVWHSLDGPGGDALIRRLRARFHHALIDEFQDTDELQWKIFRRLYLESGDATGHHTLCIIGDPKQAIYSFRGADVVTYLRARDEIERAGGAVVKLQENFRSTPRLVAANHALMSDRLGRALFDGPITYDAGVVAATDRVATDGTGQSITPVHVIHLVADAKLAVDRVRARFAAYIRDEIAAILHDPQRGIEVSSAAEDKSARVTAKDIFVLTRTASEGDEIALTLRAAGIPCALYKQEGLFQTAEAAEVRDLLAGIADPGDRSARFRAWQTAFFGVALADLSAVAELPETHPLVARLYEWKALATRLAYEELFSRILADSGLIERELFLQPSERGLTNYLHLFELLSEHLLESRCELHELVHRLQGWIDDVSGDDSRNIQRLDSDRSAVQIMTVHKAKGLEAKVVFLYGGLSGGWTGALNVYHDAASRRLVHVGSLDGEVKQAVEAEARAEDQRLMYVALTRAVARTYLPFIPPGTTSRKLGFYGILNDRLMPIVSGRIKENSGVGELFSVERVSQSAPAPRRAAWLQPSLEAWQPRPKLLEPADDDPRYQHCRDDRRGFTVTSYTRLKRQPNAAPIEAAEVKADVTAAAVELPADELPGGASSGVFLHHVLEHVPFESVIEAPELEAWRARDDISRLFRDSMLRHGQDLRYRAHSERLIFEALTAPLALGETRVDGVARVDRAMREIEFLYPMIPSALAPEPEISAAKRSVEGGSISARRETFVKGFIDLVFEQAGRVYLLDWKSDVMASYDDATLAAHVANHYRVQAKLYTIAVAKMLGVTSEADYDARFGGVVYTFLRGVRHCFERPSYAELARAEAELAKGRLR